MRRATVRSATPLMERKALSSCFHNGSCGDQRGDLGFEALWPGAATEPAIRRSKPAPQVRSPGGADCVCGQFRLIWRNRVTRASSFAASPLPAGWHKALDLGEPGDDAGVDAVSLFEPAPWPSAKRRTARGLTMAHGYAVGPTAEPKASFSYPPVASMATSSTPWCGRRREPGDARGVVLETCDGPVAADAGIQIFGRNVHSTNDLCHGNLPCACDCDPCDCSVVCDTGGGPIALPRLQPEGCRAPTPGDRTGGRRSDRSVSFSEKSPTLRFRYRGCNFR